MKKLTHALAGLVLLSPSFAFAHTGYHVNGGFMAGFTHPLTGFDHLLAMLSVGILSVQLGGKAVWKLPATFVAVMLLGGVLGMNGFANASVEMGIVGSVLALGIAISAAKKLPVNVAMGFTGLFALFHGLAHGAEMPQVAAPALYALGFIAATAAIHMAGVWLAATAEKVKHGDKLVRLVGAGFAGIGLHMAM